MTAVMEWVRRIMAYLIFTTAISNILKEQSYQKYVKLVCGIILIFLLAEPLFLVLQQSGTYQFHLDQYLKVNQAYDTSAIEEAGARREEFLLLDLKKTIEGELAKMAERYGMKIHRSSIQLCEESESENYGKVQYIELIMKVEDRVYRNDFDSPEVIKMRDEITAVFQLPVDDIILTVR